jgi:tRNA nucleotidyltransferase (CCA-adding enzyme)
MSPAENINLARQIREELPSDLIAFIKRAGDIAEKEQQRIYLVGGVVRDLLLERCNLDLDIVVEGDAIKLAEKIASDSSEFTVKKHTRFGTATIKWEKRSADLITARAETYARPGALPIVRPGTIRDDLARRDFSINAMAIELNPRRYGQLIDPFNGRQDLEKRAVRVLHVKSFTDDATRIWRAVRYEQRLDFRIEPNTLLLVKRDIDMLKTISGDRIRHELEHVFKEELPEKALKRAGELGVLSYIHPSLKGDEWLAETYTTAREFCSNEGVPQPDLYLALLAYRLTGEETDDLISYLNLPGSASQLLLDTQAVKSKAKELSTPGLAPSIIYNLLHDCGTTALTANMIGTGSETFAEHIELYLNVLRRVKPALTGEDLERLGVPRGPKIKDVLFLLRAARLDGKIDNKKGEEEMVRERLKKHPPASPA